MSINKYDYTSFHIIEDTEDDDRLLEDVSDEERYFEEGGFEEKEVCEGEEELIF